MALASAGGGTSFELDSGGSQTDSANRIRTSAPFTIFEYTHGNAIQESRHWNTQLTGAASTSLSADTSSKTLSTTTANGDEVIHATNRYIYYSPGKSQQILFTGNFNGGDANVRKRYGYFDELDGLFFQMNGTGLEVVRRTSVTGSAVDVAVAQASFNLDKLDGTGASGQTIDLTKQQLFTIDFRWLGSGKIRYGVLLDGEVVYCHEIKSSNILTEPWSATANLPMRAEITNLAALGSGSSMDVTCMNVTSEGTTELEGDTAAFTNGINEQTIGASEAPLFSMRLNPSFNRFSVRPILTDMIMTSGTKAVIFKQYHDVATLTGASWTNFGSISQVDYAATAFTGGTLINAGYLNVGGSKTINAEKELQSRFHLGRKIDGTSDIVTVTAQTFSGSAKIVVGGVVREFL